MAKSREMPPVERAMIALVRAMAREGYRTASASGPGPRGIPDSDEWEWSVRATRKRRRRPRKA